MKNEQSPTIENQESSTSEHQVRLQKVHALRALGINPWPEAKAVTATAAQVHDEFKEVEDPAVPAIAFGDGREVTRRGQESSKQYDVAGRVMIVRHHGKASFAVIQDPTGRIQLYFRQDELGDERYEFFKSMIDMGDVIWATGPSFKTKMGEITLKVTNFQLLSKSLRPLPEKFHGIVDIETIYRQRYLDLLTHPESRARFIKRSALIKSMREYLDNHGFMEVETPMLHPIPGGAVAKPFVTHHNALDADFYLRIAPELYLKRLVVGGFERVYEINRNFRNEGVSTRHNPEFTMVELYIAHHDYHYAMDLVQNMLRAMVKNACGALQIRFNDFDIDFSQPFKRMTIKQAVMEYGHYSENDLTEKNIDACIKEHKAKVANKNASLGEKIYALFETIVEHRLIQPTFVTQFPIEVSPLAKRDTSDPRYAARFELFIAGMEISNGFNELNDPIDQAERFEQQARARAGGDVEAHYFDADYILALEHGLPPTAGVGIGIDRFAMIVTNASSIKDVILFPTLKPL